MGDSLVVGVASALGSALLTYMTTFVKIRQDLAAQYDADLRQDRISVYKQLWQCTEPLARYAPERVFTFHDAHALAADLRRWYFEQGGLFLSEPARDAYFELQKALKTLEEDSDRPLPNPTLEKLMEKGSAVRTQLSKDVGTRAQAILRARES
jgi:hypothetical protein